MERWLYKLAQLSVVIWPMWKLVDIVLLAKKRWSGRRSSSLARGKLWVNFALINGFGQAFCLLSTANLLFQCGILPFVYRRSCIYWWRRYYLGSIRWIVCLYWKECDYCKYCLRMGQNGQNLNRINPEHFPTQLMPIILLTGSTMSATWLLYNRGRCCGATGNNHC